MKRRTQVIAASVAALALLAGVGIWYQAKRKNGSTDKFITAVIDSGSIRRTVSATGTIQAVVTVQVGSQISGRIQELNADFNSVVKKGQVLAVIDPSTFQAQQQRAAAALTTAKADIANTEATQAMRRADLASAKANVQSLQVALKEAQRQFGRSDKLFKEGLIPQQDYDAAQAALEQAEAKLTQGKAQLNQSEASLRSVTSQLEQARARVLQAEADLRMAEVNLGYTRIVSPIDGVVVERNVDIGQTVAASLSAPTLFLIANDLTKMQVFAQVDEADIGVLSENAQADFTVDAFPGQTFRGKISEIRLTSKLPTQSSGSSSSSNVVIYSVIMDVTNPQMKLRPGMTANVNFTVQKTQDVMRVANSALRYKPSDRDPAEIARLMKDLPREEAAAPAAPNASEPQATRADRRSDPSRVAARMAEKQSPEANGTLTPEIRARIAARLAERGRKIEDVPPEILSRMAARMAGGSSEEGGQTAFRHRPGGSAEGGDMSSGPGGRHGGEGWGGGRGGRSGRMLSAIQDGTKAVIAPSGTDAYGIHGGMKIRFPQAEAPRPVWGLVWVLDASGKPQPRKVKLGISDGRQTAILGGDLKPGDSVILGEINEDAKSGNGNSSRSPFTGGQGRPGMGGGRPH